MTTHLNLRQAGAILATVNVGGKTLSVKSADKELQRQIQGFLVLCAAKGIRTFVEPDHREPEKITIIEKVVFAGERGFLPALARRLRFFVPGGKVEVVQPDDEAERVRNLVRHELASLPTDQELAPAVRQVMSTIDKLSLGQAKEVLDILKKEGPEEK